MMSILEKIKPQINECEVVSFDIFDTLLLRPYVKPTDLFIHLEKMNNAEGFAKARILAEKTARKVHSDVEDITVDEIYAEIATKYQTLKEKELELEKQVLFANPEIKEVYDYVIVAKKRVVIISDMYLSESFLSDVLHKNGYAGFEKIYVSGNRKKKKGTGTIYSLVLEDIQLQPSALFHIGDNKKSDYDVPVKMQIKAFNYEQVISRYLAHNDKARLFLEKYPDNLDVSVLLMNFAFHWLKNQEEDFWSRIGYEYGGPISYAYMRWVEQQVLEKNIKEILFIARDGYSLQKVFDSFDHKDIKTHYVYAPRQVFTNCFIDKALECNRALSVLKGYQNENQIIKKAYNEIKTNNEAKKFIENNKEIFANIEQYERKEYAKYIESLNIKSKNIALIDTITEHFLSQKLLEIFQKECNFTGYYWNILNRSRTKYLKTFVACQWGDISHHSGIKCWDFIEYMLTSPEPPIQQIRNCEVLYTENVTLEEKKRESIYLSVSEEIQKFAENIKYNFCDYEIIKIWTNLLFEYPTIQEKYELSKINTAYDASHEQYRPLYRWETANNDQDNKWREKYNLSVLGLPLIKVNSINFYSYKHNEYKVKNKISILNIPMVKKVQGSWFANWFILGLKFANYKFSPIKRSLHILGIPVYKIKGIASPKNNTVNPKSNIANIRQFDKEMVTKKYLCETVVQINRILERKLSTFALHQKTFPQFKGINKGKEIVIVATGPTLMKFKPIKNAVYIGVNRAIQYNKIHYDYFFVQDYSGATPTYINDIYNYGNCIKFIGLTTEDTHKEKTIPEMYGIGENIFRYRTDWENLKHFKPKYAYDLATTALGCGGTVVLPAIQFALWTHPKRIYLVGCDTSRSGYFDNKKDKANFLYPDVLVEMYKELKEFANQYYPDVEIISINPDGLKGIFKDEYQ